MVHHTAHKWLQGILVHFCDFFVYLHICDVCVHIHTHSHTNFKKKLSFLDKHLEQFSQEKHAKLKYSVTGHSRNPAVKGRLACHVLVLAFYRKCRGC